MSKDEAKEGGPRPRKRDSQPVASGFEEEMASRAKIG